MSVHELWHTGLSVMRLPSGSSSLRGTDSRIAPRFLMGSVERERASERFVDLDQSTPWDYNYLFARGVAQPG